MLLICGKTSNTSSLSSRSNPNFLCSFEESYLPAAFPHTPQMFTVSSLQFMHIHGSFSLLALAHFASLCLEQFHNLIPVILSHAMFSGKSAVISLSWIRCPTCAHFALCTLHFPQSSSALQY